MTLSPIFCFSTFNATFVRLNTIFLLAPFLRKLCVFAGSFISGLFRIYHWLLPRKNLSAFLLIFLLICITNEIDTRRLEIDTTAMLLISAMLIINQSLGFVLTTAARSKWCVFITSCQGRLVLPTFTRSEIAVSVTSICKSYWLFRRNYQEPNRQVLQDIPKDFLPLHRHCFYKKIEQIYQVCLSVIEFQ